MRIQSWSRTFDLWKTNTCSMTKLLHHKHIFGRNTPRFEEPVFYIMQRKSYAITFSYLISTTRWPTYSIRPVCITRISLMTPGRKLSNGRLNIISIELDKDSLRIITLAQCRLFCDIWSSNMYSNVVSSTTLYDFIWRNFSYWFFISKIICVHAP